MRLSSTQTNIAICLAIIGTMAVDDQPDIEKSRLLEEDAQATESQSQRGNTTKTWPRCSCILILTLALLTTTTLLPVAILRFRKLSSAQNTTTALSCGETPAEAESLGCLFSIWSYTWVPEPCYDAFLVNEWVEMRDWEYYTLPYGHGELIPFDQVLLGQRTLYSTWGQHYWHCAFGWKKFLRIQNGSGIAVTDKEINMEHGDHCMDTIAYKWDERPWEEVDIKVTVGYEVCYV